MQAVTISRPVFNFQVHYEVCAMKQPALVVIGILVFNYGLFLNLRLNGRLMTSTAPDRRSSSPLTRSYPFATFGCRDSV